MKKLLLGVLLLLNVILFTSCSTENGQGETPTVIVPDIIQISKTSLPTSYLNSNTYQWNLINATYIPATQSTIYSITQTVDFNFFNTNKAKSKTLKAGGVTFINPTWDKFYTVIEVNLVKKINYTKNVEVIESPTYNKAGYPMIEFYLRDDSNGNVHYYTKGSDNKINTQ